jgi:hypothetical protein
VLYFRLPQATIKPLFGHFNRRPSRLSQWICTLDYGATAPGAMFGPRTNRLDGCLCTQWLPAHESSTDLWLSTVNARGVLDSPEPLIEVH